MSEKPKKYLFSGSRNWTDEIVVKGILTATLPPNSIVIQGGARGLDRIIKDYAWMKLYGEHKVITYPANWALHGRAAGPIRNQEMLIKEHLEDYPISYLYAFPMSDSIGTWDMIEKAKKASIPVWVCDLYL